MRKVQWIFFSYVALVVLVIVGIAVSFAATPPRRIDTLYTFYGANIKSLDPAEIGDTESDAIANNIFECLYNYRRGVRPYQLYPELAAGMPQVSDDGKTVVVKIRPGIHYYDPEHEVFPDGNGPEVKATDFVYSWKRIMNFQLASPQSSLLQGKIVGLDDWWNYTQSCQPNTIDWDKPVEGLTALDDYTLQIKLVDPWPQLNYILAYLPTAPVCRQAVNYWGENIRKHPIGTGPYMLTDNEEEQRIVEEANPIYRGRSDIDGLTVLPESEKLPKIKRVQYDYFQEGVSIWLLFQQGLFDSCYIPPESFKQAITVNGDLTPEMVKKGIKLIKAPEEATYYIGFNMQDQIVGKNKALRQAISMGYDRETFIRDFVNGRGEPAIGPIPPGFDSFDPDQAHPYMEYNLPAARAKIKEAEQFNGGPLPELQLLMGDTSTSGRQEADFFVTQMKKIGLDVDVQYRTWSRFQEMIDNRQAQIFMLGWVADYPDEQDFFQLFYGKNAGPAGLNPCAYVNPQFDALYDKATAMQEGPERTALYKQMSQIVNDDCPWGCTFYPVGYSLYYDWLHGVEVSDFGHGYRMYLTLDADTRLQRQRGWH